MGEIHEIDSILDKFEEASRQLLETNISSHDAENYIAGAQVLIEELEQDPSAKTLLIAKTYMQMLQETANSHARADANYRLAIKDKLTGLPNRETLEATFDRFAQRIKDGKIGAATLIIVDANEFKTVNDYLGHDAGDRVLQAYANTMRSVVPQSDYVARIGGDEFLIIIGHKDGKPKDDYDVDWVNPNATKILNNINDALDKSVLKTHRPDKTNIVVPLNLTFGAFNIDPNLDFSQNMKNADNALYREKANKPIIYDDIKKLGKLETIHNAPEQT